jgi:hypothetical protein
VIDLVCLLAEGAYRYIPFLKPAPLWDWWYLLALPLCLGISIVYKAVRCEDIKRVPREAASLFVFIIVVMVACAAALGFLVRILER